MGLISFLSCLYFVFMAFLLFNKKKYGSTYIRYGILTFMLIMCYGFSANVSEKWQSLLIFATFSLMILLFGLTGGLLCVAFSKLNRFSISISIFLSLAFILLLFNLRGIITYMYIPVLMHLVQSKYNQKIIKEVNN